jgi:hypothetical protein
MVCPSYPKSGAEVHSLQIEEGMPGVDISPSLTRALPGTSGKVCQRLGEHEYIGLETRKEVFVAGVPSSLGP